jgi:hypothetical protein
VVHQTASPILERYHAKLSLKIKTEKRKKEQQRQVSNALDIMHHSRSQAGARTANRILPEVQTEIMSARSKRIVGILSSARESREGGGA